MKCVVSRILMGQGNSVQTRGQSAGHETINLCRHQTSVQALMQSFLIKTLFYFLSVRNANNYLIVIGLPQVVHAVQVGIFKKPL